ncbi:MAG TPA: UDP-N-acetylglucosamine 2-epimerase (non-hydrolyzing) [Legionellales bacterium]|nr:UDP-N-acetylglucosamine 2-epimerase (non-hydrolyzing) [Legionellales bacterium]|tara:strand:- start:2639 stop:3763 length:1125 start_codon:yes stop_codon:yes gene_type:complete
MIKVMTIVGTRPELIKMSRVIAELDKTTQHILVHTGQNFDYELNQIFFDDLGIRKPDYFLKTAGETAAKTIAKVIEYTDEVLAKEMPHALLLYGDTNSCLAVIAAKRRKIPVFHMEAGNRCFDERVPEELNRKILDHLSDINLVLSEHARRYLIAEGIRPDRIIKTGSHLEEVLQYIHPKLQHSPILTTLNLKRDQYFLVSAHREENVDSPENLTELLDTLCALRDAYNFPVIVSTHPRTQQRLKALNHPNIDARIQFLKPFGFIDYIKLQSQAFCILSDSGTITEEASLLNLPALTIRNTHERPEGMDEATLIMCGLQHKEVLHAVKVVRAQFSREKPSLKIVNDYKGGCVSSKIVRIVLSYTNYINREVWYQ